MSDIFKNLVAKLLELVSTAGIKILFALIVLFIGIKFVKWILKLIKKGFWYSRLPKNAQTLVSVCAKIVLYLLLGTTFASMVGIEMTSITAAIASAGLAVGLALQGSLSNLAGGIMILVFHPFSVGDYIDSNGVGGTVEDIGIFYTTLTTPDNKKVTLPNGTLSNSTVTDYSANPTRRLQINIGVSYGSDIEKTKAVLLEAASKHQLVLNSPAPFVRLGAHEDSALVFYVRVWVKNSDYWTVNFDLMEELKKALDRNGIEIPFNQLDVHLDK